MFACRALAFLAAPADGGAIMKNQNTYPQPIFPGRYVYFVPRPDSRKPRVRSYHLGKFFCLTYTVRPTKFNRFGQITHESRLIEIETKSSTLMFSFWE